MVFLRASKVGVFISVLGDISIVLITLLVVWAFDRFGVPFHRGLFCNDDTIRYPHKDSTIPTMWLFTLAVFIPLGVMLIWDSLHHLCTLRENTHRKLASVVFETTIVFLFGFGLTFSITDIGKYSIGRLRPHFMAVCAPSLDGNTCAGRYIQNYTCTGSDPAAIEEARLSFPSGHSSISFFGLTFFAMFLKQRLSNTGMTLLKPLLMGAVLSLAFYISLSRIFDYYHHPGDVLFGGLLGASIAMVMSVYMRKLQKASTTTSNSDHMDNNLQRKLASLA